MDGLIIDYQLTLPAILRRAETLYPTRSIVSRRPDKSLHRYTYADFAFRARRLSTALKRLGIRSGDRVATLCWNHSQHLEAYFGIPGSGAVLHTLNLRLHPDDLVYIIKHADDRLVIVDSVLMPLFDKIRAQLPDLRFVVVSDDGHAPAGMSTYESLLEDAAPATDEELDAAVASERQAAAMCYTTGTTGKPKGVLYSHRALVLHSIALGMSSTFGISESDNVMPVVPMFHANAWGLPYIAALVGAGQVFPGPHLDAASLVDLLARERVTLTAGVPTIWMGILQYLDANPAAHDLSAIRSMVIGGSAVPISMLRAFEERHGLKILQGWGMTELAPVGSAAVLPPDMEDATPEERHRFGAKAGRPLPFIEVRARGDQGLVPWDGQTMGELEVRGPWVAGGYFRDEQPDKFEGGWFRTGDIVSIDPRGTITIQDRSKDLIKSGGEWISSVALENALMGHPAVAEAAVVAVPHPKWDERPLACVVLKAGQQASPDELRAHLSTQFAKFWLPDAFEFVSEIPRTSAGKFLKSALRERFRERGSGETAPTL
jgi:fatty-acyl-CoA synthase